MIALLLVLHLLVGASVVALGDRLGRRGFLVASIPLVATAVWSISQLGTVTAGGVVTQEIRWVPSLDLSLSFRVDAFSVVMLGLVSGIGVAVCAYAFGYFSHPHPGTGRLAGLMTLFAGAMVGVVVSDHLLSLFVFWELTSVTSYLLIGNDDQKRPARDAALSAVLITGAGGLAMLAGFVLIGQQAGTYRLSELAAPVLEGGTATAGVLLVLVGAFTKSAQWPFSLWLPGAMVAPTPISTYLHAATMVKAGVYLVARLSPVLAATGGWRAIVLVIGGITMVSGGWRALRQFDLKLLLAHGTVSQLGFLMMLFGSGVYAAAQAGVVLLLAHAAFKAALFMVVGIIDHQASTRDIRRMPALVGRWRVVVVVSMAAAASMAGLPPLLGFIAKEKALAALGDAGFALSSVVVGVVVAGSILTVAYSGRFVLGVMGRFSEHDGTAVGAGSPTPPGWAFLAPAAVLAAAGLVLGLAPIVVDEIVRDATVDLYPAAKPAAVVLWAGFNLALLLSVVIVAGGALLVIGRRTATAVQDRIGRSTRRLPTTERVFWRGIELLLLGAKRTAAVVQSGSLPVYLLVILGVAAIVPVVPALAAFDDWPDLVESPIHVPLLALVVVAAVGATMARRRMTAALMLGAVGYAMAALYVVQGAPDLALTQFAIETLATVLFVLVLRFLPPMLTDRRAAIVPALRIVVSVAVGVSVFVFALVAASSRDDVAAPQVSQEMLERSLPDAKGANVVNVILVDFRGIDTLGEITVLVVAGLGAVALARVARGRQDDDEPDTERVGPGFSRSPVLDASARVLFPSMLLLSVYFLFAGHNQPGGGFVGGLTAGAAISLRYVAGGVSAVRATFRPKPWTVLGSGLLVAAGTALTPIVLGRSVLEHAVFERTLPLIGTMKTTSALVFDLGVYLVVVGLVLMAYEAFGDDATVEATPERTEA